MKQYCQICNFFKEDTIERKHPLLQERGLQWNVVLCEECYEGLRLRKTTMREWMQQVVGVPFTAKGPENKIDDTIRMFITTLETVELSQVCFEIKFNKGYAWGKLTNYGYRHMERSLVGWKPVIFSTVISNYHTAYSFVTTGGEPIFTTTKFLLYNKKGYIQ